MAFLGTILPILLCLGQQASAGSPRERLTQQTSFEDQCAKFAIDNNRRVSNATVTNHAFVAAGTDLSLPGADPSCGLASQVVDVDLCRVSLEIATSNRSAVLVEVWMPADWNGRLVTTGNGGLGGCEFWHPSLF